MTVDITTRGPPAPSPRDKEAFAAWARLDTDRILAKAAAIAADPIPVAVRLESLEDEVAFLTACLDKLQGTA